MILAVAAPLLPEGKTNRKFISSPTAFVSGQKNRAAGG
jgi:hypothetical protein